MNCLLLFEKSHVEIAKMPDAEILKLYEPWLHIIRPDPNRPRPVSNTIVNKSSVSQSPKKVMQHNIDKLKALMAKTGISIPLE